MIQRVLGCGLFPAALLLAMCPEVLGDQNKVASKEVALPLVQRAYAVADLVVPVETDKLPDCSLESPLRYLYKVGTTERKWPPATEERCLMELIRSRAALASWQENGGKGSMQYFALGMSLVIEQTLEVHEQVAELLTALRRLQDIEVAVEVRLLSLPESALGEIERKMELDPEFKEIDKNDLQSLKLNDSQLRRFIALAQGCRFANLMQAPKITLFNGQGRTISIGEERRFVTDLETVHEANRLVVRPKTETVKLGIRCGLQPVVSADRRLVRLSIDFCMRQLENVAVPRVPVIFAANGSEGKSLPLTIDRPKIHVCELARTIAIADGRTAVLRCDTPPVESRQELVPPPLSQIPFLNRLYRNVGYGVEPMTLLVMVTPRVIIQPEVEQAQADDFEATCWSRQVRARIVE